jgi:benzoyl-CoA reductase/2-hydroxyglutaryl-CoA dehydratase subunit BcrC/BadD/HgdB
MMQLLRLCGFEDKDIESERFRIEKTFDILGIDSNDIKRAKLRLETYYDMDLESVRKGIGLCLKESANMVLAKEDGRKKIIYGYMSPSTEILGSTLQSRSEDIFVTSLNGSLQFILSAVFDKMTPILEAAEQRWLKEGKAFHCGNVKASMGLIALEMIPKPDLLITSGFLCDTAPKTLDLIEELYDIPTCCYDVISDRELTEYPDSSRILEYGIKSARYLVRRIEEIVGIEITDSMLMETLEARSNFAEALKKIRELMDTGDPVPIRANHDIIWYCVNILSRSYSKFKEPTDLLNLAVEELTTRVRNGEGPVKKGTPRVLSLLPSHFMDPRWEYLPYEYGMAVVSTENGFFPPHGRRTPDIGNKKPDDPYETMLQNLKSSLNQNLSGRIAVILKACENLKVDGVLNRYHVGCRIHIPDAMLMEETITKELGIPVLLLEWEGFDPRFCDEDLYRTQLEAFGNILNNVSIKGV